MLYTSGVDKCIFQLRKTLVTFGFKYILRLGRILL